MSDLPLLLSFGSALRNFRRVQTLLALFWFGGTLPTWVARQPVNRDSAPHASTASERGLQSQPLRRQINFIFSPERVTPNPYGWEEYDGSLYNTKRGYGWLEDLSAQGRDRGAEATIILSDGTKSSPKELNRLELANWQGTHQENLPLVFRIDLEDGWYRITCASVDPGARPLPLVDRRSFKCRAGDVVFAGANYGAPLTVGGNRLVQGSGIVEVTEGHLRVVVGDPAYSGWTWTYSGPWYNGWGSWLSSYHRYATTWSEKFSRRIDSGFHSLRLNSLQVERIPPVVQTTTLVFRDFFNRNDSREVNAGLVEAKRWVRVNLDLGLPGNIRSTLYRTSMKLESPLNSAGVVGMVQSEQSPVAGIIRYSTRVSLFMGQGSHARSGSQEAGILLLAEPSEPTDFNSTFLGVGFDERREASKGRLIFRVGDGKRAYRTNLEIPETNLPFKITEGEFEIVLDHDVGANVLTRIMVNGVDVTNRWSAKDRTQRIYQGLFGIRSGMTGGKSTLRQYYWYYRVEAL